MFLPRIIPVLLLKNKGLVKTKGFSEPRYIGDPINAVKVFNDLKVDELIFLDITASKETRSVSIELVKDIGDEAFMPFGVGGGISNVKQIESIFRAGAEKIVINTQSVNNPNLVSESANIFGSQSIIVSLDVKKSFFGKYELWINDGNVNTKLNPIIFAKEMENSGAGEILINSINLDGTMKGYDIELIKDITEAVNIPVIACGGAGKLQDLVDAHKSGNAHAVAAGSMFVYHGSRNAVLINYPTKDEIKELFAGEK